MFAQAHALVLSLLLSGPVDPAPQSARAVGMAMSSDCVRDLRGELHPDRFFTVLREVVESGDGTYTVVVSYCPRCWLEDPVLCALVCNVVVRVTVDPRTGDVVTCRVTPA